MKVTEIKKHAMKHLKFRIVGLIVCIMITGCVISWTNGYQQQYTAMEQEHRRLNNKIGRLQSEAGKLDSALRGLNAIGNPDQDIDIDTMSHSVTQLKEKYKLYNMKVDIAAPTEVKLLKLKGIFVTSSNVTIAFTTSSDINSIKFLNDLLGRLAGYIYITDFSLKSGDFDTILVKPRKVRELIDTKIDFVWYGIAEKSSTPS